MFRLPARAQVENRFLDALARAEKVRRRALRVTRRTAQAFEPVINFVDERGAWSLTLWHLEAAKWKRKVCLPVALDEGVALEGFNAAINTEFGDGAGEVEAGARRLPMRTAELHAPFAEDLRDFVVARRTRPERQPHLGAHLFAFGRRAVSDG